MQNTGTCGACQQAIYGPHLKAFNMTWHLDHLLCKVCQCKFEDGQVCEGMDGYAYCAVHWKQAFCPPCGHCKEPIEGPTINALDKSYHPDHFVCYVCKTKLTGQFFPSKEGEPLCENDYYHHLGLMCGGCEQPIISGKVVTMQIPNTTKEVKYHLEHFGCNFCKTPLAGTPHTQLLSHSSLSSLILTFKPLSQARNTRSTNKSPTASTALLNTTSKITLTNAAQDWLSHLCTIEGKSPAQGRNHPFFVFAVFSASHQ